MPFAATGMDLEIVVLSEVSQKKKNMYDTAYMQKKSYKWTYKTERLRDWIYGWGMGEVYIGSLGLTRTHCYI